MPGDSSTEKGRFVPPTWTLEQDFDTFLETLQMGFKYWNITTEEDKVYNLICAIPSDVHEALRSDSQDTKLQEKLFDDIVKQIRERFVPKVTEIRRVVDLIRRKQKLHESIEQHNIALQKLACHCDLGTKREVFLCAAFVTGLRDKSISEAIMAREHVNFQEAVELALRLESVKKESSVDLKPKGTTMNENQATQTAFRMKTRQSNDARGGTYSTQQAKGLRYNRWCYRCGEIDHIAPTCPYIEHICRYCGIQGHLMKVCLQKKRSEGKKEYKTKSEEQDDYDWDARVGRIRLSSFVHSNNKVKSIYIPMNVNGQEIYMLMDTGADKTVIPENIWKKLGKFPLQRSQKMITAFGEGLIIAKGSATVSVHYQGKLYNLPIVVASKYGDALLGLNWLKSLPIDWNIHRDKLQTTTENAITELKMQ